jgi:hypothetical protein
MMLGKNHNSYSTANPVNTYREEINQSHTYMSPKHRLGKKKKWHPYVEPVEWKLFNSSTNSHREATNVHDYRAC